MLTPVITNGYSDNPKSNSTRFSRQQVLEHFQEMNPALDLTLNRHVEKQIMLLTKRRKGGMETVLGRSSTYFPVLEAYLEAYNLPTELKYLAVVESSLEQNVKSKVGAAGLWQFMPKTGRAYGLRIDNEVDERLDMYKSSEAAARYLSDLYKRFKDWRLALAAYNCGPTRVVKAIRERKSRNFWKIRNLLPKETQHYVVKFMATTYVMSYYQFYDLRPSYPDYDLQFVKAIKIYGEKSFVKLAKESGAPLAVIKQLNPSYQTDIIPANPYGNYVVVPKVGLNRSFGEPTAAMIGFHHQD